MENTQEIQMPQDLISNPLEISTETEEKWDEEEEAEWEEDEQEIELPSLPPQPNLQKMGPEHPYKASKSGNDWLVWGIFILCFFSTVGYWINEAYSHPSVNTATANQCIADNGVPILNSREVVTGCRLYQPTPTIPTNSTNPTQTPTLEVRYTNNIIPPSVPNATAIVSPTAGNSATPTPIAGTVTP